MGIFFRHTMRLKKETPPKKERKGTIGRTAGNVIFKKLEHGFRMIRAGVPYPLSRTTLKAEGYSCSNSPAFTLVNPKPLSFYFRRGCALAPVRRAEMHSRLEEADLD